MTRKEEIEKAREEAWYIADTSQIKEEAETTRKQSRREEKRIRTRKRIGNEQRI